MKEHPKKIFQIFLNKLDDFFKQPETISIKQPSTDDWNEFVIIPDYEKAEYQNRYLKETFKLTTTLNGKNKKTENHTRN